MTTEAIPEEVEALAVEAARAFAHHNLTPAGVKALVGVPGFLTALVEPISKAILADRASRHPPIGAIEEAAREIAGLFGAADNAVPISDGDHVETILSKLRTGEYFIQLVHPAPSVGTFHFPREIGRQLADRTTRPAEAAGDADTQAVIAQIVGYAEAIASQAGVGSLETAGQIVSFLADRPELLPDFMAGTLSSVDSGMLDAHNGRLTWHGADGKVYAPDPSKVRFPAARAALTGEATR